MNDTRLYFHLLPQYGYAAVMFRFHGDKSQLPLGQRMAFARWFEVADLRQYPSYINQFIADWNRKGYHVDSIPAVAEKPLENRFGGDSDFVLYGALSADIDANVDDGLRRAFRNLPRPTLVVKSGKGIHLYWKLREPQPFSERMKGIRLGIARTIGGDESLQSPSHKLRLPGTLNVKYQPPVMCRVLAYSPSLVTLDDFSEIEIRLARYEYSSPVTFGGGHIDWALIDRQMNSLINCSSGQRNAELNAKAYWLGRFVGAGRLDENSAEQLLLNACYQNGLVKDDGQNSVLATIRSGLRRGKQNPRDDNYYKTRTQYRRK